MFKRFAVSLLAATIFSAPVMAQAPAPSGAPAASDTAKPAAKHVHKAEHVKAKKPEKHAKKGFSDTVHDNPKLPPASR
jgi:hypothetical protein